LDEIIVWGQLADAGKRQIWQRIAQRKNQGLFSPAIPARATPMTESLLP
jgi:predicted Fe-S protein YdhL (DUF1289 family)